MDYIFVKVLLFVGLISTLESKPFDFTVIGCYVDGKHYQPGEEIDSGKDIGRNACWAEICDSSGSIEVWDNFDCFSPPYTTAPPPTTTPITRIPTTLMPTTVPLGCYANGKYYHPGEDIDSGVDKDSNWCYGRICGQDGMIIHWDKLNCFTTTETTTPFTTTTPTPIPFHGQGCYVDGKYYKPGQEIDSGEDRSSNWCYGRICNISGVVENWDNFNCFPTTTTPTTTATDVSPFS